MRNKYQQREEASVQGELFKRKKSDMSDAERVLALQSKLYQKAKQERKFKFYVLYDKMFLHHFIREAWKQVRANRGAPGVDGVSIEDVERIGVQSYLEDLGEDLRKQTYRPSAVKRAMVPKANGGERPLGIPTVRDRIAQTVCKMILEPIFEADFSENSYGFRPKRSSKDAIGAIRQNLETGNTEVLDADLSKYFDTIPHDKLVKVLEERISDPRMLKLIKKWLKTPVQDDKGNLSGGKRNKVGTPQGGVISPLLANAYLNLLDRTVDNIRSVFHKYGCRIVRYADDFVIMAKAITEEAKNELHGILQRMGLTLNAGKTHTVNAKKESFDFLGFTFRYDKDIHGRDNRYWNVMPSSKSEKKIREKIKGYLKSHIHHSPKMIVENLNPIIRGWLNYFDIKKISYLGMSKRKLRHYLVDKLYRLYNRKSQRKSRLYGQKAFKMLVEKHNLIDPTKYCST